MLSGIELYPRWVPLTRGARFFVHVFSLPSLHYYDVKLPISRFLEEGNTGQRLSISFREH